MWIVAGRNSLRSLPLGRSGPVGVGVLRCARRYGRGESLANWRGGKLRDGAEAVEEVGISTGRPKAGRDKFKVKSGEVVKQEVGESATLEAWLTY